jgi:hypothetical protein
MVRPPDTRAPERKETILDSRLDLAREFIANGVPVFIAKKFPLNMSSRAEYDYPEDWPYIDADEKHLEGWKPLYAVCAVTGIAFDVLDIDPRNGGDAIERTLWANQMMPPPRGTVATPSGGTHYYIKRSHFRKYTPWEGVDLQAGDDGGNGRGFVFIPPTKRKGKHYQLTQGFDWQALREPESSLEYSRYFEYLFSRYDFTKSEENAMDIREGRIDLEEADLEDLKERLSDIVCNVRDAKPGTRDTTLNKECFAIGGLLAGCLLPDEKAYEEYAVELLQKATDSWDITQNERDTWVTPKILRGIEQGKLYPILCGF